MPRAIFLLLVAASCAGPALQDDYGIYSKPLAREFQQSAASPMLVVPVTGTLTADSAQNYIGYLDADAAQAMIDASGTSMPLANEFSLPVQFFDPTSVAGDPRADAWWQALSTQYPTARGFVSLSRVGYSGDLAALIVTSDCGLMCGCDYAVEFHHVNGAWTLTKFVLVGIA